VRPCRGVARGRRASLMPVDHPHEPTVSDEPALRVVGPAHVFAAVSNDGAVPRRGNPTLASPWRFGEATPHRLLPPGAWLDGGRSSDLCRSMDAPGAGNRIAYRSHAGAACGRAAAMAPVELARATGIGPGHCGLDLCAGLDQREARSQAPVA